LFRTQCRCAAGADREFHLVPHWATLDHFNELDRKGLMMYADDRGSWIISSARRASCGHLRDLRRAVAAALLGSLLGKWILTAGSAAWAAPPALAATMAGARCSRSSAQPRHRDAAQTGYLDQQAKDSDEALGDDRARVSRAQAHFCRRHRNAARDPAQLISAGR